jgi:hypothetical protein
MQWDNEQDAKSPPSPGGTKKSRWRPLVCGMKILLLVDSPLVVYWRRHSSILPVTEWRAFACLLLWHFIWLEGAYSLERGEEADYPSSRVSWLVLTVLLPLLTVLPSAMFAVASWPSLVDLYETTPAFVFCLIQLVHVTSLGIFSELAINVGHLRWLLRLDVLYSSCTAALLVFSCWKDPKLLFLWNVGGVLTTLVSVGLLGTAPRHRRSVRPCLFAFLWPTVMLPILLSWNILGVAVALYSNDPDEWVD